MPKFVLFILLIVISFNLQAQTWEFGGSLGEAGYMGDLSPNNPLKVSGIAGGVFFKRNFDGYWSVRLNGTMGRISAADSNSSSQQFRNRNLSFTTLLDEVSLTGEFNFMSYIPDAGKNKFTPYIFLGIAAVNYSPTTLYKGQSYNLRDYRTEGQAKSYPKTAFSIPYGAGFKCNIAGNFTLGFEIGYRHPNTDYLDDVSGYYPKRSGDPVSVALADRSGELTGVYTGSPGTQRGDLRSRDTYFFTQFTLSYTFVTERCYFQ